MTKAEYESFYNELISAESAPLKKFEKEKSTEELQKITNGRGIAVK